MEYCLETSSLCKQYRHFTALSNLTMRIPKGSIYGLIGKNGAGKTTLIRQICGLQDPTSGAYKLYGTQNTDPAIYRTRKRMGAVVETPSIYLNLTAAENLKEQYRILGQPSFDGIEELLTLVGLSDTGKKKAKNFSLGMRQRLGIAIALCGHPDFLVLDELINGLDPQGIIEIRELILKLNQEQQITFLISSHILDELSKLATHYGFIDKGTMVREISAAELESHLRKRIQISVTDRKVLCRVLDQMGLEYSICSESTADIFGEVRLTPLVLALAQEGCEVLTLNQHDESLENYYMNLIGKEKHHE